MMRAEAGFSLIEALVALLVLAIAAVGLVRASEAHVDSIRGLERRGAAMWVAENRLAELGLPGGPALPTAVEMLGQGWTVRTETKPTDDPDLRAVTIRVAAAGEAQPLATLDGFVDAGTTTP
ncbi:type II secretion system minor pseudopilin GspI [Sphingomonas profundi]|uniref:type II secretion system minor pseudopilin GspI n=1 Tax=Alterirhizorhabdus profundi TaxID=2681549 RepID=UPI0018D06CD9|nr:type II secretion system minor pseudopilin GspI [Sphingomonas profundi]